MCIRDRGDYKSRTLKLIEILKGWTPHNYLIASPEGIDAVSYTHLIYIFCIFNENALYKMTTAYISYSDKLFIEYIKKRIPPH